MDHLDAATLKSFKLSTKKFYMPNNAVLVAGDFKTEEAKQWIQKYFGNIKRTNYRKTNFCRRTNNSNN
jgi:predicted Zn-dependent peptidase